jgi:hypothetical protein
MHRGRVLQVRIHFPPAKSRANSGTVTLVLDAAPAESPRTNPRNRCLPSAELNFRIHSPPADSPSLSRSHFRASRTRAFPAGVRGSLDDGSPLGGGLVNAEWFVFRANEPTAHRTYAHYILTQGAPKFGDSSTAIPRIAQRALSPRRRSALASVTNGDDGRSTR